MGGSGASASVTSLVRSPPAATPLSHEEVLRLVSGDWGRGKGGGSSAGDREAQDSDEDPVEQVHLGLGGEGEAVVTFATWRPDIPSKVRFGKQGEGLVHEATGTVATYTTLTCLTNRALRRPSMRTDEGAKVLDLELADLVNTSRIGIPPESAAYMRVAKAEDAWGTLWGGCIRYMNPMAYYESPYLHTVVLSGLLPRSTYSYRPVGSTRSFTFTMPPGAGDSDLSRPLKLAVWGDIGITNISYSVMRRVAAMQSDVLLTVGDYSYADGWSARWETFGILMEPLMSSVVGLGVPGNHEFSEGYFQGNDFVHRFPQPYRQSGSTSPMMYSYDVGLVHVLGLPGSYAPTTNTSSGRASPQYLFAASDLARVDRSRTPWIVVMFHTPWYSSNRNHYLEGLKHQWDMEDLFHYHGVDVVFNGHVHSYERSYPVYKGALDPCGAVHIVIGDSGNYEGPAHQWNEPQPVWSAFREAAFGAGSLTVLSSTEAEWEWRRVACVVKGPGGDVWIWPGQAGLNGEPCSTDGDNSATSTIAVDIALLSRDTVTCPNKRTSRRLSGEEAILV